MEAHMIKRNESNRRPIRRNDNRRNNINWNEITCYNCGKQGHTLTICRERRTNGRNNQINYIDDEYYYENEYENNIYNMDYQDDEYNDYEYENEIYEVNNEENDMYEVPNYRNAPRRSDRNIRNKDQTINEERMRRADNNWNRRKNLENLQKGRETKRNNNICQNCGQIEHYIKECVNEKVKFNRRVPNVEEFEPVKAFMNSNANITWAQLINERPNVRKQLRGEEKTQTTRCNVIINGKAIRALVNTGAGSSTITNKLRKKLNIPIIKKSNVILTIADEKSIASLGIAEIDIEIDDELGLTLEVEVKDSKRKDLILGTDLLKHGIIDMKEQLLTVELDGEIYEIPIDYEKKQVHFKDKKNNNESSESESSESESDEDEYLESEYEDNVKHDLCIIDEDDEEVAK
ncbi:hypothetical protein RhiirA5_431654 [Rhizophagus irregularis]|uniref:CCHC-type domain-containing protein n=1 Tax=Rhizophagus irregularis TaxID=588596 RepID=A0A2N0NUM5_9GLOM|nr:hypothetical protein RhiirA5_431654 [Rhizophagus irregularis]